MNDKDKLDGKDIYIDQSRVWDKPSDEINNILVQGHKPTAHTTLTTVCCKLSSHNPLGEGIPMSQEDVEKAIALANEYSNPNALKDSLNTPFWDIINQAKAEESSEGVLKTGISGLNGPFTGGFRRGQFYMMSTSDIELSISHIAHLKHLRHKDSRNDSSTLITITYNKSTGFEVDKLRYSVYGFEFDNKLFFDSLTRNKCKKLNRRQLKKKYKAFLNRLMMKTDYEYNPNSVKSSSSKYYFPLNNNV